MRKFLAFSLLLGLTFTACKKSESVAYDPTQLTLRTWVPTREAFNGTTISRIFYDPDCSQNSRLNFTAQGRFAGTLVSIL